MAKKIEPPFVRSPFNYDTNAASDASALTCPEPTLARQEFAEECDINFIADRYGLTGEMPQIEGAQWGVDYAGIFDFQSAQNAVIEANRQFMTLPAKLRARFNNDPQKLLEFMADDDNRKEAEFLGLVTPPAPPEPVPSPQEPAGEAKGGGAPSNAPAAKPDGSKPS